jgi:hypothetical protein
LICLLLSDIYYMCSNLKSVMRTAGIILLVIGIVGTLVFGIQAIQDTETFSFLGIDIGVSSANWTPVIVSAVFLLVGIVLMSMNKKAFAN